MADNMRSNAEARTLEHSWEDENYIDLGKLFGILWTGKWLVLGVSFVVGIVAVCVTLQMPDVYQAEALLAPAEDSAGNSLAGLSGRLGGLASLAGVGLGNKGNDKTVIGIEYLKSRAFITDFVERRGIAVELFAAEAWDKNKRKLTLNESVYDSKEKKWLGKFAENSDGKPSALECYEALLGRMNVSREKETGLITIAVTSISPVVAKQWVDWLVEDLNADMRKKDIERAEKSILFLQQQLEKTPIPAMQQILYQLIEKNMQTILLASVEQQYVFKSIDPAMIPEKKSGPRRSIIVIGSVFASAIFVCLGLLLYRAPLLRNVV